MTADFSTRRARLRGGALIVLAALTALLFGLATQSAAAAELQATRTLRISVSQPGTITSGSTVTVRCRAKDQKGKAIKGARVTFRWRLPEGTRTQTRITDGKGLASASRVTTCENASQYRARVVVTARWRSQTKQVTRSFWIVGST